MAAAVAADFLGVRAIGAQARLFSLSFGYDGHLCFLRLGAAQDSCGAGYAGFAARFRVAVCAGLAFVLRRRVAFAGREEEIALEAVLLGVEIEVTAA